MDRLMEAVFEPEKSVERTMDDFEIAVKSLLNKHELLKKEIKEKDSKILELTEEKDRFLKWYKDGLENFNNLYRSITPVHVYHNKKRRNTTIKFQDGSSETVTRMKGDKESLETAIVYALYKKVYGNKRLLEFLVSNVEETEGKKCKKH